MVKTSREIVWGSRSWCSAVEFSSGSASALFYANLALIDAPIAFVDARMTFLWRSWRRLWRPQTNLAALKIVLSLSGLQFSFNKCQIWLMVWERERRRSGDYRCFVVTKMFVSQCENHVPTCWKRFLNTNLYFNAIQFSCLRLTQDLSGQILSQSRVQILRIFRMLHYESMSVPAKAAGDR